MKVTRVSGRWRPMVGVAILGVFAFGLTLQGAPTKDKRGETDKRVGAGQLGLTADRQVTVGPGIPKALEGKLPVLPPVVVDYRNDDTTRGGQGPMPVEVRGGGGVAALSCTTDEICNDCDPCTEDLCMWACVGGDNNGLPCNSQDDCPGGACPTTTAGTCTNRAYGAAEVAPDCDDGLFCNGSEVCIGGVCAPNPTLPCVDPQVCDEQDNNCVDACTGTCDDLQACTTDTCEKRCEGGSKHGDTCTVPADCQSVGETYPRCVDVCIYTQKDCGLGGICQEPVATCTTGRCCNTTTWVCTDSTLADCTGQWLGVSDCDGTPPANTCPKYGSGIIDGSLLNWQFPFDSEPGVVAFGPASGVPNDCDPITRIGDDYTLDIPGDYLAIELLRFAGGVMAGPSARFAIELRDATGEFIEDVWYLPLANATGGPAIRTVIFDPPLVIPKSGIISMSVQTNFGPGGRIFWLSTDGVDRGGNNATTLYVDGAVKTGDFLGQCNGGDRDGLWCTRNGTPAVGCPGGSCADVPDILAFEIIGTETTEPWGACCNTLAGTCSHAVKWECDGVFKGVGTFCAICLNSPLPDVIPCDQDSDCPTPSAGMCKDQVCNNDPMTECLTDDDCPGGECINLATACATQACCATDGTCSEVVGFGATCPGGTTSLGFATSCAPNCCEQPLPRRGRDNCNLAATEDLAVINLVGNDVAQVTLTGNNSTATFDDHNDGWCDGAIFDPDGATKDPGWWHAFSIDDCAYVRVELCCTDPVLRPQWAGLYTGCPCDLVYGQVGIDPPIGVGEGTAGHARGLPFCDDDNTWGTYGPLPAGTYYVPIYSAPDGTFASPPGGDYQLNIYAQRCPASQCCYLECTAPAPAGTPCTNDEDCPGGSCVALCGVLDVLDCQDRNGWWLPDIPSCGTGVCNTGACCIGPGECVDNLGGNPITYQDCFTQPGLFWGGAECVLFGEPNDPCPICPIDDPVTCTRMDGYPNVPGWIVYFSDSSVEGYESMHRADDFVATGEAVREVCVWGSWIDRNDNEGRRDCACLGDTQETGCTPRVEDNFQVCVWTDDNTKPGTLVACSPASMVRGIGTFGNTFDVWLINLTLDSPIGPLTADATYWIDVTNNTVNDPGCTWYWNGGNQGNPDYGNIINANDWSYVTWSDAVWDPSEYEVQDMTWCIDAGIPPSADTMPQGACCICEPTPTCVENGGEACLVAGGSWQQGVNCTPNPCPTGLPPGDLCAAPLIATDGVNAFSNKCATTDGFNPVNCGGNQVLGRDVWYRYIAPETGARTISFCDITGWDGFMAVYSLGTSTCPPCPTASNANQIACNDELCVESGGPPELIINAVAGNCYLIRVGGWVAAGGDASTAAQAEGTFTISPGSCPFAAPAPAVGDPVIPKRVRYLSFSAPGGETQPNAVRVKLVGTCTGGSNPGTVCDSPADCVGGTCTTPYPASLGKVWYVGQPTQLSEVAGKSDATPPTFWTAELQTTPYATNWSTYPLVHVYGRGIAPNCTYEVALAPSGCEPIDSAYSTAILILASKWGDTVGANNAAPPQGVVDFTDIASIVDKFKNSVGAPQKSRANVGSGTPCLVDKVIDFADIPLVVDAFRGVVYPPTCVP